MASIAVLGGGPAGLASAWWAAEAAHDVVLFEQAERTGGMAGSLSVAGIRADFGSHRLHPAIAPDILAALQALPGLELAQRPRHGRIRIAGRWLAFPLRTADLLHRLPPDMALRAALDALTTWARRPRADTYAEVVRAGLGPTMADRFYNPYARKLWGLPARQLAGEQARRRISTATPLDLLRKVLAPDPDTAWFWYPRGGFGDIVDALDDAARGAGAEVLTRHPVERIALDADGAVVSAGGITRRVDLVLSTLPVTVLVRLVQPPAPEVVRMASRALRTRAMVLVYLVVDRRFSPFDAHYIPEAITPVTRLSEPPNYAGVNTDGRSLLCAEIPCDLGDATWRADDASLARMVADGMVAMGLTAPPFRHVESRRVPHAYPVMTLDAPRARDRVDGWVATLPRLLSFGRHGLYAHDNTHHALAEARAAVDSINAGYRQGEVPPGDVVNARAWTTARAAFRAHVVED